MNFISTPISKKEILEKHRHFFKKMIKAVIDVEKQIIALDAELHADIEELLLKEGCKQENLWGINLYLEEARDEWIEYTALINIRPALNNRGMEVENPQIREKIRQIVNKLIIE